ncbi:MULTISPECIES: DUF302 domain-containing protein [unclassified Exiguobacterium]|uniref:DUF302 domain-containing protein n=1 Tax=unclassified Exiguobacterium TaxID=2644629 RepID=UPI001BEADC82|nr:MULTISPECIES: DUF302 domain-containing protein [unclassified Exiguobacterium]
MFDYTVQSDRTVEDVIDRLNESLKEESFGVLWDFDLSETLEKKGQGIDGKYRILEVCNPKAAKEVLSHHLEGGYFLPCKIAVFEKGDHTQIGMPKPTELIRLIDDESLHDIALDVESRLKRAIDQSK